MGIIAYSSNNIAILESLLFYLFVIAIILAVAKKYINKLPEAESPWVMDEDFYITITPIAVIDFMESINWLLEMQIWKALNCLRNFIDFCCRKVTTSIDQIFMNIDGNNESRPKLPECSTSLQSLPEFSSLNASYNNISVSQPFPITIQAKGNRPGGCYRNAGASGHLVENDTCVRTLRNGKVYNVKQNSVTSAKSVSGPKQKAEMSRKEILDRNKKSLSMKIRKAEDWYGYQLRQEHEAQIPEIVQRFGRPRSLLQGSNVPKTLKLLRTKSYSQRPSGSLK